MNFKSPYPWAEAGRLCKATMFNGVYDVEIIKADYKEDKDFCICKLLKNNKQYYVSYRLLEPYYTIEEIMQYAEKTIIEKHWVDFNGDERALYLLKFCGEYFRIDEYWGKRKMKKVEI